MANTEEPAYMLAARMSVRHQESASPVVVAALLGRIDTLEKENGRLRADNIAELVPRTRQRAESAPYWAGGKLTGAARQYDPETEEPIGQVRYQGNPADWTDLEQR